MVDAALREMGPLQIALRRALAEVFGAKVPSSRLIADTCGFGKSLGWACRRIATEKNAVASLSILPGTRGWAKVVAGLRTAGCTAHTAEAVASAAGSVQARLDAGQIDRNSLRALALDPGDASGKVEGHLELRRSFFEVNRLMWGVSAKAVVATQMLAPSRRDPKVVDLAALQIVHGLVRHREGPPWTFYYTCIHRDDAGRNFRMSDSRLPDDPSGGGDESIPSRSLIEDLSSPGILDGEVGAGTHKGLRVPNEFEVYEFTTRAAGRRGPLRAVFGEVSRAVGGRHASEPGEQVTLGYSDTLPISTLVRDVLLHRDLLELGPPKATLHATVDRHAASTYGMRFADQLQLPLGGSGPVESAVDLPTPVSSCSRAYRTLVERAATALHAEASDFVIHRTVVPYPPFPSTAVMTLTLPLERDRANHGGTSQRSHRSTSSAPTDSDDDRSRSRS